MSEQCDHAAQLSITNYGPCAVCGKSQDSILMERIAALEAALKLANHQIEVLRTPPIMIYTTS